jgi:hypothetical protein
MFEKVDHAFKSEETILLCDGIFSKYNGHLNYHG